MSCLKLPTHILNKLKQAMIKLWWNTKDKAKKISWISWADICLSKREGGLGIMDLGLFNQTLLSKQGWRLLTQP